MQHKAKKLLKENKPVSNKTILSNLNTYRQEWQDPADQCNEYLFSLQKQWKKNLLAIEEDVQEICEVKQSWNKILCLPSMTKKPYFCLHDSFIEFLTA